MKENRRVSDYNTGISMLKIWLVMSVVVCHFLDTEKYGAIRIFTDYGGTAVPVLVLISFLLTNMAVNNNNNQIRKRLSRLFLPQCFFAILYFAIYKVMYMDKYNLDDLLWQIVFGSSINAPMWFVSDMIMISILFYTVFRIFKGESGIAIIICIGGVAVFSQYTGINYSVFGRLPDYAKWSLGRVTELIPVAVIGVILSYYKIMDKIINHKVVTLLCAVIGLYFCNLGIFSSCDGFYYQGMYYIVSATCLTVLFWTLPFDRLPKQIKIIINNWSRYNMGIIATHYLIKSFYDVLINHGEVLRLSIVECLGIYILSLIISIIAAQMPIEIIRKSFT